MDNNTKILGELINNIVDIADKERLESEPYKDLFTKSDTAEGLLRNMDDEMTKIILNGCTVLKQKFGLEKIGNEKFHILQALPFVLSTIEKDIRDKEGSSCCVDKAFYLISKKMLN